MRKSNSTRKCKKMKIKNLSFRNKPRRFNSGHFVALLYRVIAVINSNGIFKRASVVSSAANENLAKVRRNLHVIEMQSP